MSRAASKVWRVRRSVSGWMTLKVAETLGMPTPAAANADRTAANPASSTPAARVGWPMAAKFQWARA
jgi:hypothetical protein